MKRFTFLLMLLLGFGFVVNAQKQVDTSQQIVPLRLNAESTYGKPYVIYISIDGLRYDYMEKYNAEFLLKAAGSGVWAKEGMLPVFPSATFPNHYSLATGMYPAHHGIVDNYFYDPARDEKYIIGTATNRDGSWYGGNPIWTLAEKQGVLAASLFWVGSESNAGGMYPSYYYKYHQEFSDDDKVRIIKEWLSLPIDRRPHMITLYFPEVDHAGHKYGPDADETKASVLFINEAIRKLDEALAPLNLPINYILVSDHGMITVEEKDYVKLPFFDKDKYVFAMGTHARITAFNEEDIMPMYELLNKEKGKNYEVYLAKDVPAELHFSSKEDKQRRIGDIIILPNGVKYFPFSMKNISPGKHGYDPLVVPEMKATFMAWGPAFNNQQRVKPFRNIHVYPVIAEILGLEVPADIDGDIEVLGEILKD